MTTAGIARVHRQRQRVRDRRPAGARQVPPERREPERLGARGRRAPSHRRRGGSAGHRSHAEQAVRHRFDRLGQLLSPRQPRLHLLLGWQRSGGRHARRDQLLARARLGGPPPRHASTPTSSGVRCGTPFSSTRELDGLSVLHATSRLLRDRPSALPARPRSRPCPSFRSAEGDLDLWLGAAGLRFNPTGNLLISANALFSLGDEGLQNDDVIPVVSIDYSF